MGLEMTGLEERIKERIRPFQVGLGAGVIRPRPVSPLSAAQPAKRKDRTMKNYFSFDTHNRYGKLRTIRPTDIANGVFKVMGKSLYSRGGEGMYDFEGGPFLMVGEPFYGLGTIAALQSIASGYDGYCAVLVTVDYNEKSASEAMKWQKRKAPI